MLTVGFNVIEKITKQFDSSPSARVNGSLYKWTCLLQV